MVILTGDTHGFNGIIERLYSFKHKIKNEGPSILIVLGDFGLMWNEALYDRHVKVISDLIKEIAPNLTLAFLSGNHENFNLIRKLEEVEKWGNKVGYVADNIFHLKTGRVYTIDGETYAIYGGAFSIDRAQRVENVSWWKEEITSAQENQLFREEMFAKNWSIDYLLTHTCATNDIELFDMYPFTGKREDPVARDIQVIKEGIEIRKFHAFGHFHINRNLIEEHKIATMFEVFYAIGQGEM